MASLEERHALADRALGYVELYGAYTETEARYRVDRLLALWDRMDEDDRQAFCLDPGTVDWDHYVREVHLPSVIEHARVRTTPGRSVQAHPGRAGPQGHPLPRPPPGRLRPREHPAGLERGRRLRLAGLPAPAGRRAGRLRRRPGPGSPVPPGPGPPGPGRLPPLLLPALRGRPRRPPVRRRLGSLLRPAPAQVVPGRHRPGPRSTGPSATAPSSSPGPSTWWWSRSAPCSTRSSAPAWARRTAGSPAA